MYAAAMVGMADMKSDVRRTQGGASNLVGRTSPCMYAAATVAMADMKCDVRRTRGDASNPLGRTSPCMYAVTTVGMADTNAVSALRVVVSACNDCDLIAIYRVYQTVGIVDSS